MKTQSYIARGGDAVSGSAGESILAEGRLTKAFLGGQQPDESVSRMHIDNPRFWGETPLQSRRQTEPCVYG